MTDRSTLREFLLGGLTPEEAEALEDRMFADEALYRELDEEREALVEDYLAKSLPGKDSARFERQMGLSPELSLEVAALRDLKTVLQRRREGRHDSAAEARSFWRPLPLVMAACLLGLVFSSYLQWRSNRRLHADLAQVTEAPRTPSQAPPAPGGLSEQVVFLAAALVRGPRDATRIQIAPGTSLLQLQIELPAGEADTRGWAVEVSHGGQVAFRSDALFAKRAGSISYLPVYLAVESLPAGLYSVRMRSADAGRSDESRTFTVERH